MTLTVKDFANTLKIKNDTLLERMRANVKFGKCPKTKGAMVTIQWQTNNLLST